MKNQGKAGVCSSHNAVKLREQNQVTIHLQCNLEMSSVKDSITLPAILTLALLSALSFTEKYLFPGNFRVPSTVQLHRRTWSSVTIMFLDCIVS